MLTIGVFQSSHHELDSMATNVLDPDGLLSYELEAQGQLIELPAGKIRSTSLW